MSVDIATERTVSDGFVLVHRTLINTGRRLTTVLRRSCEPLDLSGLAGVWSFYCAGLAEHHEGETQVIFPLVTERDATFAQLEASMAGDHAELDGLLAAAQRAVEAALSNCTSAERGAAADAVAALVGALDAHLGREEALVLPRVAAVIAPDEMTAIERGFLRRIGARRIAMTVAALDETAHREHLPMPPLPLPARLALPMWRRRYRRILAGAGIVDVGGTS